MLELELVDLVTCRAMHIRATVLSTLVSTRPWTGAASDCRSIIRVMTDAEANWAQAYIELDSLELPLIHRDLALHRSAAYDRNASQLGGPFSSSGLGPIVLVVEVGAWVTALAERA